MAEVKQELPPGYIVPVHRSLTQKIYWGGVPRNVLLCEFFGGVIGGIIFKSFTPSISRSSLRLGEPDARTTLIFYTLFL